MHPPNNAVVIDACMKVRYQRPEPVRCTCLEGSASVVLIQIIGAPIAAGILFMDGVGGLRGWQWLFILEGSITAIYGIVLKVRPPSQ